MLLVFDTETRLDKTQALTFGVCKLFFLKDGVRGHSRGDWQLLDEVFFHGDDVSAEEVQTLETHARERGTQTGLFLRTRVMSREQFVELVLWRRSYKDRALVVNYNSPFDLSRLAVRAGAGRGERYAGGVSLTLYEYGESSRKENRYRGRIHVQSIDSKRSLIGWGKPHSIDDVDRIPEGSRDGQPDEEYAFPGYFLDLRTLAYALSNESYTLDKACKVYEVGIRKQDHAPTGKITPEEIEYCRRDVDATFALACRLFQEFDEHPVSADHRPPQGSGRAKRGGAALHITNALSPASIAKAYLRLAGLPPFMERSDVPAEYMGFASSAFFGGRAECRVRGVLLPVTYCDFLSMYPTVDALLGLDRFLRAERIAVEDCTEEVQELLDSVTLEDCFDRELWPRLVAFAEVEPNGDDHLPARCPYGGTSGDWQIGINPLTSDTPLWFAVPELIASKLRTSHAPRVRRAFRLVPHGIASGLRPVMLRRRVPVDPRADDLFRVAIEERNRLPDRKSPDGEFLKVYSNSGGYGIFAEANRKELGAASATIDVYGPHGHSTANVNAIEEPGEYSFMPIAAVVTAAARLMLMLLEASVTEPGGTYVMCDTDSMAIVATEEGGLVPCIGGPYRTEQGEEAVRALSFAGVEAVRERFRALSPYDPETVPGSILKIEDENFTKAHVEEAKRAGGHTHDASCPRELLYAYAISAKRYTLRNRRPDGSLDMRKCLEHGLGHLLNPTDPESDDDKWIEVMWELIVREHLGLPTEPPPWLSRVALTRMSISSPFLLRPFRDYNRGKPYAEQVKPFNFILSAHVSPLGYPAGADPTRFHLVAPYNRDPRQWRKLRWVNLYTGERYAITTTGEASASTVRVRSYADVLADHCRHPEAKSCGPDGRVCQPDTRGLLGHRPVHVLGVPQLIGKESNRLEDVDAGLVHDPSEVYTQYSDVERDNWFKLVVPVLRLMPRDETALAVGLSSRQLSSVRQGRTWPRETHRTTLLRAAGAFANAELSGKDVRDPIRACATYLVRNESRPT